MWEKWEDWVHRRPCQASSDMLRRRRVAHYFSLPTKNQQEHISSQRSAASENRGRQGNIRGGIGGFRSHRHFSPSPSTHSPIPTAANTSGDDRNVRTTDDAIHAIVLLLSRPTATKGRFPWFPARFLSPTTTNTAATNRRQRLRIHSRAVTVRACRRHRPVQPRQQRRLLPRKRRLHPSEVDTRLSSTISPGSNPRSFPPTTGEGGLSPPSRTYPRAIPCQCKEDSGSRTPVRICRLLGRCRQALAHSRSRTIGCERH